MCVVGPVLRLLVTLIQIVALSAFAPPPFARTSQEIDAAASHAHRASARTGREVGHDWHAAVASAGTPASDRTVHDRAEPTGCGHSCCHAVATVPESGSHPSRRARSVELMPDETVVFVGVTLEIFPEPPRTFA